MARRIEVTVPVTFTFTYDSEADDGMADFYGVPVTPQMLRDWARQTVAVAGAAALEGEGAAYGISNVTSPESEASG